MSSQFPIGQNPTASIRTSQIIAGAMIVGVLTFGVIATVMGSAGQPRPPMIAYIAVLFAAQIVALRFFVPGLVVKSQLKAFKNTESNSVVERLPGLFQTQMIIGLALLEGAAFFNLIAYMTEVQWFSLAVAGFLLALMAMIFPTISKFESWAGDVQRNLNSQF